MPDHFRGRNDTVNVVCVFRVDDLGTFRFARRGELSDYRPTVTCLEWWNDPKERWEHVSTVSFLEAHDRVRDLMDL